MKHRETPPPLASHLQNYPICNTTTKQNNLPFPTLALSSRTGLIRRKTRSLLSLSYKSWMWRWGKSRPSRDAPTDETRAQLRGLAPSTLLLCFALALQPLGATPSTSGGMQEGLLLVSIDTFSWKPTHNISALLGRKKSHSILTCSHLSQSPQLTL